MLGVLIPGVTWAHQIGDAGHDGAALGADEASAAAAEVSPAPPRQAPVQFAFKKFAPAVQLRTDDRFLYIESNGLPAHPMMAGITAWQQQVPLPQPYRGANAWRVPLAPVPAAQPVSIKNRFLRGAIAIAANGIPIFNPQNNRGEVSFDIGELDQWGGHCGRADDYHYHIAPLHLQAIVGPDLPIACALDGYPIYGLTEPDGSVPKDLDAFNGHTTAALGYHYHASKKYPFVNGGFHGTVVEREGQVDPQPRAHGVRPALTALRGAKILSLEGTPGATVTKLVYSQSGGTGSVSYVSLGEDRWKFQFVQPDGTAKTAVYPTDGPGEPRPGDDGRGRQRGGPRQAEANRAPEPAVTPTREYVPPRSGKLRLASPAVRADGVLPVEFTGDGDGKSPPLAWEGAPAATQGFAVIMHHIDPQGQMKWYWTLYNLPADTRALPPDAHQIGTLGNNSVNRERGYAPPHSKGPGEKTYVLTLYALSKRLELATPPEQVSRAVLLAAMKDLILDSAELKVVYSRPGNPEDHANDQKRRP